MPTKPIKGLILVGSYQNARDSNILHIVGSLVNCYNLFGKAFGDVSKLYHFVYLWNNNSTASNWSLGNYHNHVQNTNFI